MVLGPRDKNGATVEDGRTSSTVLFSSGGATARTSGRCGGQDLRDSAGGRDQRCSRLAVEGVREQRHRLAREGAEGLSLGEEEVSPKFVGWEGAPEN
jgi:hypothetical protein